MEPTHRSALVLASTLLLGMAVGPGPGMAGVAGADAPAAAPTSSPTGTPGAMMSSTPTRTPTATSTPTVTPAPTQAPTGTPIPTQDPEHPPLQVSVVATTDFGCDPSFGDHPSPDGCTTNVDDRGLTFTGAFDGAQVLQEDSYSEWGHGAWFLALPGTAVGVGPGGSVQALVTSGPPGPFRVIDVACVRLDASLTNESNVPATLDGNAASFTFDVGPDEDGDAVDCRFSFDPAAVPRFRSAPAGPSVPPTDTFISNPAPARSAGPAELLGLLFVAVVVAAVVVRTQSNARRDRR